MKINLKKIKNLSGLLLFPVVHFYLLEAYTHNAFTEVRPWAQLFNILLFELAAWILIFLFRNIKWALRAEGIFAMVIGLVNYYVYTFRSLPLVPWDLFSVDTAFSVADQYSFVPTFQAAAVLAGFVVVLYLEGFLEADFTKWKWYGTLSAALAAGLCLWVFSGTLQNEDFQNRHRMYNKLFTPVYMWQVNGFALTMVMELPFLSVEKPAGYQKEEAEEILASYEAAEEDTTQTGTDGVMPNIIVIMDEAFSDLSVLGKFQTNKEVMPYVNYLFTEAENTITGHLGVSVCGGNTANTEFEFLTGNTMAFLPQGSIPYQQYIHNAIPALPSYLRELGYDTYGMHPYLAKGWERDQVYPMLGFSHTKFIDDFQNRSYIRRYISDKACMDEIIDTYEKRDQKKPLFLFQVTMQNHGSYQDTFENFTPDITVEGASSYSLSSYLSLIRKTDEALEYLLSYFSEKKEPVMVVFFGDHQPNDAVAEPIWQLNGKSYRLLSEEDTFLRYQVPYLIWTNYDSQTVRNADTSANYLGAKVLEAAGLKMPAYQKFLLELSESCPIVSAAGIRKEKDADAILEKYTKLQYYQLFDNKVD